MWTCKVIRIRCGEWMWASMNVSLETGGLQLFSGLHLTISVFLTAYILHVPFQHELSSAKYRHVLFVHRDAEDAVYGRNGYDYGQCRLRVEFPKPSRGRGGGFGGGPRGRNGPPSRRSEFRVLVSGMLLCSVLPTDWDPS